MQPSRLPGKGQKKYALMTVKFLFIFNGNLVYLNLFTAYLPTSASRLRNAPASFQNFGFQIYNINSLSTGLYQQRYVLRITLPAEIQEVPVFFGNRRTAICCRLNYESLLQLRASFLSIQCLSSYLFCTNVTRIIHSITLINQTIEMKHFVRFCFTFNRFMMTKIQAGTHI